jgi:hypothetical protein
MVYIEEVRAQVAARYALLELPSWADPHPGMTSPGVEEYSRVTGPERYRIVEARASVWADTLGACSGVEVELMPPEALDEVGQAGDVTRAVRLCSTRSNTLPLLLLTRQVPSEANEEPLVVLEICVDRVSVVLARVPDCGCDACDSGSDSLLEAIDDIISGFVSGPSVMLRGPGWRADWRPGGGSSGGDGRGPDHEQMMQLCRRLSAGEPALLPENSEALVSSTWLD